MLDRDGSPVSDSSDGSNSTLSCITVKNRLLDAAARSSVGASSSTSTQPTSVTSDVPSVDSDAPKSTQEDDRPTQEDDRRRSLRPRQAIATYNVGVLTGTAIHTPRRYIEREDGNRTVSGQTLVEHEDPPKEETDKSATKALEIDWTAPGPAGRSQTDEPIAAPQRRKSTRLQLVKEVAKSAIASASSSLGKRGREAYETSKDKLQALTGDKKKTLRHRTSDDTLATETDEPSAKKARFTPSASPEPEKVVHPNVPSKPKAKRWEVQGLYVGQERPKPAGSKRKRKSDALVLPTQENKSFPLPMFGGERLLNHGRDFKLPYDVLTRLPVQAKPDDWQRFSRNRMVGDAAKEWKKARKLAESKCNCTPDAGCGEDCLNRTLLYECDENNCNIGAEFCTNRAFAELERRRKGYGRKKGKNKDKLVGNDYDFGVEVLPTEDRGYGVRAMRSFEPNQIIMEYAGEIITQEECDRRMRNEYKNNKCYYLMVFDRKMIIDATKGSIARFVNHSCAPNCRMVKWVVAGEPRMALFAGENGILPGEELTYDYNFDPFSQKNVQQCLCGAPNCRGVLGPRQAKDNSKAKPNGDIKEKGIVAGAKRKLQEVLKKTTAEEVSKRRKIAVLAKNAIQKAKDTLTDPAKDRSATEQRNETRAERLQRRKPAPIGTCSSSGFTLGLSGGKLARVASSASASDLKPSRNGSLRRPSSKLQRLGSVMSKRSSLSRGSTSRRSTSGQALLAGSESVTSVSETLPVDNSVGNIADNNTAGDAAGTEEIPTISQPTGKTSLPLSRSSSRRKAAVASLKHNLARSVRGARRTAAMAAAGPTTDAKDTSSKPSSVLVGGE